MAAQPDRERALGLALAQIDKQFGRGSVMRLGERPVTPTAVIPTGSIALDVALGIGGLPRGRVVEIYGPESSGKCLTADTYLWTDRGLETVAELFSRCGQPATSTTRVTDVTAHGVRMVNERGQLEPVAALTHNNRKPVLTLTLRSGRTITATRNHPLRVSDGYGAIQWRSVCEIRAGDVVVSAAFGAVDAASGDDLSEDEAVLLGYLAAGVDSDRARTDPSGEFDRLMARVLDVEVGEDGAAESLRLEPAVRQRVAEEYGTSHAASDRSRVPHRVRTGGDKTQRAFLSGLFEATGWIDPPTASSATIGLATVSEQLAREVQLMLYGHGLPSTLASTWSEAQQCQYWSVAVPPGMVRRFLDEVGFRSGQRRAQAARLLRHDTAAHAGVSGQPAYTYEEVVKVVDGGTQPTFDVVLPRTHSFLANGILSHNTTVALHAVANAQAAGGIAAFIDAEHALDPDYAKALGVDTDALLVSQPDTGEQALEIADMLIRSGALDIVVIDSVAALVPRAEIEGEMGDSHVGLQARLMSQALRKITGALNNSSTTAIFINQLREKIGVMFGCMSHGTRVTLADGTQEKIGKIVNQRMDVEVLSYNPETDRVEPRRITNWFDNGDAEYFLQFTAAKSGGNGRARFAATPNHLVRTPGGWACAGDLVTGDRVMVAEPHRLSEQQWQVILGSLMGSSGNLSPDRGGRSGVRFRIGHGADQAAYLDWKTSLLVNIECSRRTDSRGTVFADFHPLPELNELRSAVYLGDGKKHLGEEYLKALTPLALAIWYMDDGGFTPRSMGRRERAQGGSARIEICVEAMSEGSRQRLVEYLRDTYALDVKLARYGRPGTSVLRFSAASSAAFQEIVAPYVHGSMDSQLLPTLRGRCRVEPDTAETGTHLVPARILDVHVKPKTRSMHKFDIEVEGNHNYFVDGVMVHNSPETTTGGRALKFYASVRLDVRRVESLKDGTEVVGNRTRVKIAKNKCLAEGTKIFDPMTGITHTIEEIVEGRLPVSVVAAAKDGTLHVRPVTSWFDQGEQDVLGVRLRGGATLWATPDHKVMTDRGWKVVGDLAPGDRVAQPREFLGFGDSSTPAAAEERGSSDPYTLAREKSIPAEMFAEDVSRDVVSNLLCGLFETDGYVSAEQTGAVRVGFTTTSEQLAHQIHWLLLRYGVTSSVRRYDPTSQRPSLMTGRHVQARRNRFEVRITGSDNVAAFADAVALSGPRGEVLSRALHSNSGRRRGSQSVYLADEVGACVLAHLHDRGVTPKLAAQLVGPTAGDPRGGMKQVLGVGRIRRDRLARLAEALEDPFLLGLLGDQVRYASVREVLPSRRARTFDVEVDELHTLVADGLVVHNCAAPFKQAEFDIMYGKGISREGSLIDVGVEQTIIRKSGAWYTYEGDQLGQGKENARAFLHEHPDVAAEIEKRILEKLGVGQGTDSADANLPPVDF